MRCRVAVKFYLQRRLVFCNLHQTLG